MALFLLLLVASYLIGAIPFALIIGRVVAGIDIRHHGSGNVGTTNVMRSVNVKAGLLCFLLDFLKGLLPTLAAKAILSSPVAIGVTLSPDLQWLLVGAVAIIGHCFPVYLMSVGGKGIATSIGVFTALLTLPSLICIVVGLTILFTTGYMALCSCVGITLLPFMTWILGGRSAMIYVIVTAIIALILDLRHAGNFRRLFNGTEPRIWDKAKGRDEGVPAA